MRYISHYDLDKVFHSYLYDSLTSAILSMQEIKNMVDEMFAASKEYLPFH